MISNNNLSDLYRKPLLAKRGRGLLALHPYPTKIDPAAIAKCILNHTEPGDTVVDCFSGSGTTGIAALLCDTDCAQNSRGPRKTHLFDVSGLAAFISKNTTSRIEANIFEAAANDALAKIRKEVGGLYQAVDPSGNMGEVRYIIWSEILRCPGCSKEQPLFDLAVKTKPARVSEHGVCQDCNVRFQIKSAQRVTRNEFDPVLRKKIVQRMRVPVIVYGVTGSQCWSRRVRSTDLALLKKIAKVSISKRVPVVPMGFEPARPWGEMYRAGYHVGISHVHHFYTVRNALALAKAFCIVEKTREPALREILKLWVSSYNQAHMTLMTRVVAKKGHGDLTVTSGQSGVLYISGLPVEKNLVRGLESKLRDIAQALAAVDKSKSSVAVHHRSGHRTGLKANSVDYVFTDPPFGDYIQYSEINRITESWLGLTTRTDDEAIVSRFSGKSLNYYQSMLSKVFLEMRRILKPGRHMTLVFHSGSPEVWNALRDSWEAAGFKFVLASILDKRQSSFKQVVSANAVQGDALILLEKVAALENKRREPGDIWGFLTSHIRRAKASGATDELKARRLYGRAIAHTLSTGGPIEIDAKHFYSDLARRFPELSLEVEK